MLCPILIFHILSLSNCKKLKARNQKNMFHCLCFCCILCLLQLLWHRASIQWVSIKICFCLFVCLLLFVYFLFFLFTVCAKNEPQTQSQLSLHHYLFVFAVLFFVVYSLYVNLILIIDNPGIRTYLIFVFWFMRF